MKTILFGASLALACALTCSLAVGSDTIQGAEPAAFRLKYERHEGEMTITGHGTCFAINDSQLLTAAHNVLDERDRPYATLTLERDGKWEVTRVIRFDKDNDIALIAVDSVMPQHVQLGQEDARAGAPVKVTGSARGTPIKTVDGKISKRFFEGRPASLVSIAFDHGLSGAPMLNADGLVIGMAVAGLPLGADIDKTVGLFIPLSVIKAFLEDK